MKRRYDPEKRAREKQAARDRDERALASGEVDREQLVRDNGALSFPLERLRILAYR